MDKKVSLTINVITNGETSVKQLTASADELAKSITEVQEAHEGLNQQMININQLKQSWDNLYQGCQQVAGIVGELTAAYNTQEQAEVKLDTIMRQRMGATDGMVESVKQLCSEQQQLGVIGDEVQLSGAQQMATFLNEKQSLDQLIPAMNNLLAQQKGLNATEQDAVSIGNMMGKAMQGQVEVLQRVGITFTDAQKEVLKYGTEQERAAMLAEVIKQNVGEMNKRLAETDGGKAKQVANTLGDMKEVLGRMLSPLQVVITQLAGIGQAVNAVTSLATGMRSLASITVISATNAKIDAIAKRALAAANITAATATRALSLAIKGLMIASGVGLVVVALTTAIEAMTSAMGDNTQAAEQNKEAMDNAAMARQQEQAAMRQTRSELEMNIAKLKNFKGTKEQEKKVVEEMNRTYGETMGYFSSVSKWYEALVKNSQAYCKQMVAEARARSLANQIAEAQQNIHDLTYNEDGTAKQPSKKKTKKRWVADNQPAAANSYYVGQRSGHYEYEDSDYEKVQKKIANEQKKIKALNRQLEATMGEAKAIKMPVIGATVPTAPTSPTTPKNNTTDDNKKEQETIIENAKSYQDLAHNVRLYDQQLKAIDPQQTAEVERLKQLKTEAEQQMEAVEGLITTKREEKKVTEEVVPAHIDQLNTMEQLNNAISYYNEKQQKAQASEVAGIQTTINQLERKKAAMEGIANLTNIREQTTKLDGMGEQKLKMELELIGLEGVKERIRELQDMLDDTENPLDESQRKEVKKLMTSWQDYEAELKRSQVTFQGTWGAIKGVGSGVEGITNALEGNGNAWQTITGLVDGAIAVYDGISKVTEIIDALTAANTAATVAEEGKTLATEQGVIASQTATVAAGAETAASLTSTAAKSGEAIAGATASGAKMPFPLNLIAIAAGVAAVLGALALITGGFADGGVIPGTSYEGDKLLARVNSGEMILNRKQQAQLFSMLGGVPKFASGGLAYGPTLALVGEYGGASGNPEVIAPLDKLRGLIGGGTPAETEVRFRIRGRELVGLLEKEYNLKNRT